MSNPTVLVTGASGQLGRRVVELLLAAPGHGRLIATTRNPETLASFAARGVEIRRTDFDAEPELAAAFAGADRALLISTDAVHPPGRRLAQHAAAIRAFERAGVNHVVYTSAPPAPSIGSISDDHQGTETLLAGSRFDHTILRNNLYAELWLAALPAAVASGQLADARGDGATGFVTREDCARAAAAVLLDSSSGRRTLTVTGPALLTSREVAELASSVVGRPIAHVTLSVEAVIAGMVAHGLPEPVARIYAAFDVAVSRGEFAVRSEAVEQLTGRPPQSLHAFLSAHRELLGAAR